MNVLLIADRPGWAYDILAKSIIRHNPDFHLSLRYIIDIRDNIEGTDFGEFDVVYFFLWYDAMRYGPQISGFDFGKTCVGVHSIASWENRNLNREQASLICNQFAATGYISKELGNLLQLDHGFFTPNGVESSIFFPSPISAREPLRLMWVGNPSVKHHGDNKGFNSIVQPVVDSFDASQITLQVATPENPVVRERMGDFYRSNHVLICTSKHEGGPLPVVEALACGRPVISTEVGIVPEIVENRGNGLFIQRSRQSLQKAIHQLLDEPNLLDQLANQSSLSIHTRLASETTKHYRTMFEFVFQRKRGELE
jgi:glycosyltransferase involved in cell wall biosynthesis